MTIRPIVYPRWQSIGLMAVGAPVSVLAATLGPPAFWTLSLLWVATVTLATGLDALSGWMAGIAAFETDLPSSLEVGGSGIAGVLFVNTPPKKLELHWPGVQTINFQARSEAGFDSDAAVALKLIISAKTEAALTDTSGMNKTSILPAIRNDAVLEYLSMRLTSDPPAKSVLVFSDTSTVLTIERQCIPFATQI